MRTGTSRDNLLNNSRADAVNTNLIFGILYVLNKKVGSTHQLDLHR